MIYLKLIHSGITGILYAIESFNVERKLRTNLNINEKAVNLLTVKTLSKT